jgi:serine/threonine protein kinase
MEVEWLRGDLLGKGAFARVYSVENLKIGKFYAGKFSGTSNMPPIGGSSTTVALPMLKEIARSRELLRTEIAIHSKLSHPNIVRYIDSFSTKSCYEEKPILLYDEKDGTCEVLILEMCPNKSIHEMLKLRKRLLNIEALFIIKEVAKALLYLKERDIIHRDIKPANIMLCGEMQVKLADFGLAINKKDVRSKKAAGTPNYISPEMLEGKGYSYPADVWSLGCVLYALLFGRPPFDTNSKETTFRRIKGGIWYFPETIRVSADVKILIKKMLESHPLNRITIEALLEDPLLRTCMLKRLPFESRAIEPTKEILAKYIKT